MLFPDLFFLAPYNLQQSRTVPATFLQLPQDFILRLCYFMDTGKNLGKEGMA